MRAGTNGKNVRVPALRREAGYRYGGEADRVGTSAGSNPGDGGGVEGVSSGHARNDVWWRSAGMRGCVDGAGDDREGKAAGACERDGRVLPQADREIGREACMYYG